MSRLEDLLRARSTLAKRVKAVSVVGPRTLADAEPVLRRAIPILIVSFLIILAVARFIALLDEHQQIEAGAMQDLKVGASLMRAERQVLAAAGTEGDEAAQVLLTSALPAELLGPGRFALITNGDGIVVTALPGFERFVGRNVNDLVSGIQPLMMFGERAGVMETVFDGQDAYVSNARLGDPLGSFVFVQFQNDLFAVWRNSLSVNVTLFALTSLIMLVILYAYFHQTMRARDADELYILTHKRVDTALSRGRCGLWDWDLARGRMYWSRSMYEILGMQAQDGVLSFGDVAHLMHPDDGSLFDIARHVASGRVAHLDKTFRMRCANGAYIWLRARAEVTRNPDNEIHLIGVAVDVTEQHALARRTDEANTRLHNAVENISESFVLWDASHRLVLCNQKYQEVFGLGEADLKPGTPYEAIMAAARKPIEVRQIASPFSQERVTEVLLADGRWLQVSERRTGDGGFVSIGTDVTQIKLHQERLSDSERRLMGTINDLSAARKDAEQKALQFANLNRSYAQEKDRAQDANRAKTTFLANMSHELRTPLNAIIGFSEIMREGTFGPVGSDKYVEYASDIHASGHYLLKLIDDILDMSKIEAGRMPLTREPIDLTDIVREATKIVEVEAERKAIAVTTRLGEGIQLEADRRATKQVMLNLLANAVKFTGTGGTVELRARVVRGHAWLTIADTGIGIPRAALKKIGRPFEQVENELTRTNKGTGLGLAIARSLVEQHGGALRVASQVGRGTVVSVRMPLEWQAKVQAQAA